jgi:ATP-binding cassette subfamily B protein
VQDRPDAIQEFHPKGRVAFENVTFGYGEPVLKEVSFVAEPGQTVAILGATGSGKTSLIHLIARFYDVNAGRITIDGVDVRDLSQATLRAQVGIALQDAVLFSGTIADNIRQGRPEADDDEIAAAARSAQADEFIAGLPEGYNTNLGQRGVNLSGGQKQRLAIARALVRRPVILILDDSTSAVDVETESRIRQELAVIMAGRTSFVVAQRISTVLSADKILVLDDGRLVAEGTHEELIVSSPIYRQIYESQLGESTYVTTTPG